VPGIVSVRGMGLMIGFDLPNEFGLVRNLLLNKYRIVTGEAKPNTIRLLPSLALSLEEAYFFLEALQTCLVNFTVSEVKRK
jgi:acetylornithine aminotransferase